MRVEIYRDQSGEWRWRLVRRNNRIVADSGEGYQRKGGCIQAWKRIERTVWELNDRGQCVPVIAKTEGK